MLRMIFTLLLIFCFSSNLLFAQSTIAIYEPREIVCAEDELGNYIGRYFDGQLEEVGARRVRRSLQILKRRCKRKLRRANRRLNRATRLFERERITAERLAEFQTAKDTAQADFDLKSAAVTLARQCVNDVLDPNGDGTGDSGGSSGGDSGGSDGGGGLDPNVSACDVVGGTSAQFTVQPIINGTNCPVRGDSPVVQLSMHYGSGGDGLCSGTVVHANYVISAAHCLLDSPTGITVITGVGNFAADSFVAHPDWDQNAQIQEDKDVAVIRIPGSGIPTRTVAMYGGNGFTVGETMVISGFGINSNQVDSVFRAGLMALDSTSTVGITAKYNGTGSNTCSGDSGGPLMFSRDSTWKLGGVTSNGLLQKCGPGDTSNFANLSDPSVKSFITQQTGISY